MDLACGVNAEFSAWQWEARNIFVRDKYSLFVRAIAAPMRARIAVQKLQKRSVSGSVKSHETIYRAALFDKDAGGWHNQSSNGSSSRLASPRR